MSSVTSISAYTYMSLQMDRDRLKHMIEEETRVKKLLKARQARYYLKNAEKLKGYAKNYYKVMKGQPDRVSVEDLA